MRCWWLHCSFLNTKWAFYLWKFCLKCRTWWALVVVCREPIGHCDGYFCGKCEWPAFDRTFRRSTSSWCNWETNLIDCRLHLFCLMVRLCRVHERRRLLFAFVFGPSRDLRLRIDYSRVNCPFWTLTTSMTIPFPLVLRSTSNCTLSKIDQNLFNFKR